VAEKKQKINRKKKPTIFIPRKIKIKVVGLGGGGGSVVSEMSQSLKGVSFIAADTDNRPLRGKTNGQIRVFHFGEKILAGMGTGMNPDLAKQAAVNEREKIEKLFNGSDLVVLVGCLGGGVASGAGPIFAEAVSKTKSATANRRPIVLGIFTLPFQFEGEKKMKLAKKALNQLKEHLSAVVVVPNEKIFALIDRKTPLKKALSSLNQIFVGWIADLIEIISKPSLINIDFADLTTIFKEQGQEMFFSEAVASGANRSEEIIKKVFNNPFSEKRPANIKKILFNISGGPDLGLREVEAISLKISELNPRAKIIFGINSQPGFKGRIKLTLVAVGADSSGDKTEDRKKQKKKRVNVSAKKQEKELASKEEKKKKTKPRRSALEIKKTEEEDNEKEWATEPDWEIPAFMRQDES